MLVFIVNNYIHFKNNYYALHLIIIRFEFQTLI